MGMLPSPLVVMMSAVWLSMGFILEELTAHYERDPSTLTPSDAKRMVKQWNRRRIKEGNEAKAKR